MKELWQPASVAVVGTGATAGRILEYLRQHGYPGRIHTVAAGETPPEPVDLALVAVGAGRVAGALTALGGARYAVVHASGFGETGEAGRALEQQILEAARAQGTRLIGPNCIGLVSPADGLVAGFSPLFSRVAFRPGNLALVAQSGALGYGLVSLAVERGLGFSRIINTGNEVDVDTAELVGALLDDPATDAVLVYAEGIKRPAAWRELAHRGKPVIVLKAGRSDAGVRAAASHTAALAGDDTVWETAFRQWGFHRAGDLDEMLDLAAAFAQPRRPAGTRVGVLTTSGGAGILAADGLAAHGLTVPPLTGPTRADLEAIIPAFGSAANPVDVTAQVISDSELFRKALGALARDPGLDLLLVCFCVLQGEEADRVAADLLAVHAETTKPILVARTGADFLAPGVGARLTQGGIPVYLTPGRAARAAGALALFAGIVGFSPAPAPTIPVNSQRQLTPTIPVNSPHHAYTEPEAKALLREAGFPVTRERVVHTPEEAIAAANALGFPVVMKLISATVHHKTEAGGVRLSLQTPADVARAFFDLTDPQHGCLVQEQVTGSVAELLVGITPTPLGPMLTVGLGGIFVELLQDVARRLAPVTRAEAMTMLKGLKGYPLLAGARGRPAGDLPALATLIARLSDWALQRPGDWELDLNPVFLLPTGCTIADALLIERRPHHA